MLRFATAGGFHSWNLIQPQRTCRTDREAARATLDHDAAVHWRRKYLKSLATPTRLPGAPTHGHFLAALELPAMWCNLQLDQSVSQRKDADV
jgi:hypothetical protein